MRLSYFVFILLLVSCNNTERNEESTLPETIQPISDSKEKETNVSETYANNRFKEVTVENLGNHKFRIRGEAQVFEATINWIVEDGHQELMKGFQTAEFGAPEWGKFDFTIDAEKKQENSTLTLYLFEISARDGSRQYELPILLY